MTTILHTADIHLDSPLRSLALRNQELREKVQTATRTALVRIVDAAIGKGVAAVLISGDLFDSSIRSARTGAFLTNQLIRLRDEGIRVFYIKGNHDAESPITGDINWPDNVHVFDDRGGKVQLEEGIWIHGVSFSGQHAEQSLLPRYSPPVEGAINIAMLHTSLSGGAGHDPYAPCTVGDLSGMGFDYWALGHVHKGEVHSENPWIVMPGTPQGRDIGESGAKSAILVKIGESIEIEDVFTSAVEFSKLSIDATGMQNEDDFRFHLRTGMMTLAETLKSDAGALRLEITGDTGMNWQILRDRDFWTETVREMAEETDRLWLDKIVFDLSMNSASDSRGAVEELQAIMEEILNEPSFAKECHNEFDDIVEKLPPVCRAMLAPNEEKAVARAQELAGHGSQRILALMKGFDDQ